MATTLVVDNSRWIRSASEIAWSEGGSAVLIYQMNRAHSGNDFIMMMTVVTVSAPTYCVLPVSSYLYCLTCIVLPVLSAYRCVFRVRDDHVYNISDNHCDRPQLSSSFTGDVRDARLGQYTFCSVRQ